MENERTNLAGWTASPASTPATPESRSPDPWNQATVPPAARVGLFDGRGPRGAGPLPGSVPDDSPLEAFAWSPGVFPALFLRLSRRAFTGRLEIRTAAGLHTLDLLHGNPTALRTGLPCPTAHALLEELQLVDPREFLAPEGEGGASGLPELLRGVEEGFLDPMTAEWVAQELLLRRLLVLHDAGEGVCALHATPADAVATRPLPVAALLWRMCGFAAPVGPVPAHQHGLHVASAPEVETLWPLLDPEFRLGGARLLILGGGRVQDVVSVGGAETLVLLALLEETGLCRFTEEAPDPARRNNLLARLNLDPFREKLYADFASVPDADPWTALGLPPDADEASVASATAKQAARYRPPSLPQGLSLVDRACALAIYRHVLRSGRALHGWKRREAGRALMDDPTPHPEVLLEIEDRAVCQAERARALYRAGHFVAAAALLNVAVLLEGETPDMLAMLGWARHRAAPDDPIAGEPELRRALQFDPEHVWAMERLARLLLASRPVDVEAPLDLRARRAEAETLLGRVLRLRPESASSRRLLEALDAEARNTEPERSATHP